MGTGRTLNKKPISRPKKSDGERRRRQKAQRKRLAKLLDVAPEKVARLQPIEVRDMLKRPQKIKAAARVVLGTN